MKKFRILALVLTSLLAANVFAQNAKYTEYFQKAKSYEAKSEWVYAMGFYIDAVCADPENGQEAYDCFNKISEAIKSGEPGYKANGAKFSVFEVYESWKNLLMNAEKYWTEYCPYEIIVHPLEMGTPDYANKTAEYKARIQLVDNGKFEMIMSALMDGYTVAYKSDWSDMPKAKKYSDSIYERWDYSSDSSFKILDYVSRRNVPEIGTWSPEYYQWWPLVSVTKVPNANKVSWQSKLYSSNKGTDYPIVKDKTQLYKNGVAVYAYPSYKSQYSEKDSKTGKQTYNDYGVSEYFNPWFIKTNYCYTDSNCYMYDLKLRIVDDKGNVLAASKRYMPNDYDSDDWTKDTGLNYVSFLGITQAQMALIDSGKAWVDVEACLLQYGFQANADLQAWRCKDSPNYYAVTSKDPFYFKKNLPEVAVDMSKVTVNNIANPSDNSIDVAQLMKGFKYKAALKKFVNLKPEVYEFDDATVYALPSFFADNTKDVYRYFDDSSDYFYNDSPFHFEDCDTYVYGWKYANMVNSIFGMQNYYTTAYDYDVAKNYLYHFPSYEERSLYKSVFKDSYNKIIFVKTVSAEEKAARVEAVKAKGNSALAAKEEKLASYGDAFANDNLSKTYESYKTSVAELKTALAGNSISTISEKTVPVEAIDLDELDERLKYINQLKSDAAALLASSNERYSKAEPVLGSDNQSLKVLKGYVDALDGAVKSNNTAKISSAYDSLKYWSEENGAAIDESVSNAAEIVKNIDKYYAEQKSLVDEYRRILGKDYKSTVLTNKEKALVKMSEGISSKNTPKMVGGYFECISYDDYAQLEKDASENVANARDSVSFYEEKDAYCKELRSVLGASYSDSNLSSMEKNLVSLKVALDAEDIPSINYWYKACKKISLSNAESKYAKLIKDAAEKNARDRREVLSLLEECKVARLDIDSMIVEKSAYKAEYQATTGLLSDIEKEIDGKSDEVTASKLADVKKCHESLNSIKASVRIETAEAVLAKVGITMKEQTGSIDLWYDDGRSSSKSHVYSTEKVNVYAVTLNKKGSFAKSTKMKGSDYIIFDTGSGVKAVLQHYNLKSGSSYVPKTYDAFIDDVLKARNGGTFEILYVHKSLGSYDGFVETVTVPAK